MRTYGSDGAFRVEARTGRGLCAVAARPLAAGDLILEEDALSTVTWRPGTCRLWSWLQEAADGRDPKLVPACSAAHFAQHWCALRSLQSDNLAKLLTKWAGVDSPPRTLRTVYSRAAAERLVPWHSELVKDYPTLVRVWDLNSFAVDETAHDDGGEYRRALFDFGSRFNHSCRPNATARARSCGDESEAQLRIVAGRDLQEGEEIEISYLAEGLSGECRRQRLREKWGFECSCAMCAEDCAAASEDDDGPTMAEMMQRLEAEE
eukprot:TRINITY_DN20229_c0_g1_i1.p1 TRINITY_DN20229_c0_g1~~TRINITY_DN20229_c0_g1_i1.p1  ORF type:complete len:263 (+),score=39.47 TRINITY_DN20229_c0_g1_i1:83-871(+)